MAAYGSAGTIGVHGAPTGSPPAAAVVAPLTLSVTYRQDGRVNPEGRVYARMPGAMPAREAAERTVGRLEGGRAVMFGSGQAATFTLLHYLARADGRRRVAFLRSGYHATRHAAELAGLDVVDVTAREGVGALGPADVLWLETPNNPYIEVDDIAALKAQLPHAGGKRCVVCVDNTFAPAPIQTCLKDGADFVVTSGTKVLNGHSDGMCGFITVPPAGADGACRALVQSRTTMGNSPGAMECWLLVRSLKTLAVRVAQQCATAHRLAEWLHTDLRHAGLIREVYYPGLPHCAGHETAKRVMNGYGSMLAVEVGDKYADKAREIAERCEVLTNATSLGSVESLVEWRHQWDASVSPRLLRVSVGVEALEDLQQDILRAFRACCTARL
eukprot:TRINITY_DN22262_c0_g1_i1.p1 TRINITY_DN22262_c0_g1~~TRINITY_DN22262_c0_g1_i1.p1  ORF type:complete len:386 (+),score=98.87 TRINITY_DN22262_c0_g1_i1:50-1207(+)